MSSLSKELHVQIVTIDYHFIIRKVSLNVKETVGREKTERAYFSKKQEFQEFCNIVYLNEDFPRTITVKKIVFMYYTVYRKRKSGGRFASNKKNYFNFKKYEDVIVKVNSKDEFYTIYVIGHQYFNQYYYAVKDVLRHQRSLNETTLRNSDLSTKEMNDFIQYVKHRYKDFTMKSFKEKLDGTIRVLQISFGSKQD